MSLLDNFNVVVGSYGGTNKTCSYKSQMLQGKEPTVHWKNCDYYSPRETTPDFVRSESVWTFIIMFEQSVQ